MARAPVKSWNSLMAGAGGDGGGEESAAGLTLVASLRAHRGRVLRACWRPAGPPAFLTSSTDCSVVLWSLFHEEELLGE